MSDFNAAEVMKVQNSEAVIAAGLSVEAWLDSGNGAAGPKDQKCFWRQREGFAGRQGGNFWVLVLQIISSHNEIVAAFFCKALKRRFQMVLLALYQLGHASQRFWDVFFHLLLSRFSWCFFSIFEVVCSSFWRCSKARAPRYMETNDMFGSLEIRGLLMFVEGSQWLAFEKTHLWTGVPGLIFFRFLHLPEVFSSLRAAPTLLFFGKCWGGALLIGISPGLAAGESPKGLGDPLLLNLVDPVPKSVCRSMRCRSDWNRIHPQRLPRTLLPEEESTLDWKLGNKSSCPLSTEHSALKEVTNVAMPQPVKRIRPRKTVRS